MNLSGKDKTILAIGAHPDDVEFGCGGTLAKLSKEGSLIYFLICTDGSRGSRQNHILASDLIKKRREEQDLAAQLIGAKEVIYLGEEDGNLISDINLKEKIVKIIRKIKPDIVFVHDPSWYFKADKDKNHINHTDHRACGEATLDAIYPLSRDLSSFPEHMEKGLTPHKVCEVYLYWPKEENFYMDITKFIDLKINSILEHKSQIDDPKKLRSWAKDRFSKVGKKAKVKYAEEFVKLELD